MLFLHLKAADAPIDFGVRVHQHEKARSLRKVLDKAAPGDRANFIVAGDFNGVGMNLSFSKGDIKLKTELDRLETMYGSSRDGMPIREKTHPNTFWNGPGSSDPPSDIDHVAAAEQIQFAQVAGVDVEVKGWPEETTPARQAKWIRDFSDHALLRFRVTGVA
jgi:endonuclease/exonuclease/phosphatase family metal-dependent hydrolase